MANHSIKCKNCKHYVDLEEQGLCARHPPQTHLAHQKNQLTGEVAQITISVRPPVMPEDSCGDAEPLVIM